MKRITLLFLTLFLFAHSSKIIGQVIEDEIDILYDKYIVDGKVNYSELKQNAQLLDEILLQIKKVDWKNLKNKNRQAFLINAYNLYVIKAIIDRYPVASPKAINRFFTQKKYKLFQESYSLDQIEKDLLFEEKRDARFHLVLICAAKSCPPFFRKAFRGEILEEQLEEASRTAIISDWIKEKEGDLLLSEIFSWYSFDFENVLEFIRKYRPTVNPASNLLFETYDWGLNEQLGLNQQPIPFQTASQLMSVGTWEFKSFQSTYTQVAKDGFERDNSRSTYFSSFNQILAGVSPNLNVGLDIVWKKNDVNNLSGTSWTSIFNAERVSEYISIPCDEENGNFSPNSPCSNAISTGTDVLQKEDGDSLLHKVSTGLSHLGPKVKFRPFAKISKLTLQQTLYIPIQKEVDGQLVSFTQFFYDQRLGAKGSLFGEISFWTPIRPNFQLIPFVKSFWSYFPNRHFSVYAMAAFPGELGAGLKINLTRRFEIELLATKYLPNQRFFEGRRANTFNIGLRLHP